LGDKSLFMALTGWLKTFKVWGSQESANDSTWLRWKDCTVMERKWRINHKSHGVIIDWLSKFFGKESFSLLDCGVMSAVTYRKIKESKLCVNYTGADVAPQIIDDCRERFPDVDWCVSDVQNLQFDDSSYDVVLIRHVLEHLPYYEKAIQQAKRVSRKYVILCLFHILEDQDKIQNKIKSSGIYHFNVYGRGEFLDFLNREFSVVEEQFVEDPQRDNQVFFCEI